VDIPLSVDRRLREHTIELDDGDDMYIFPGEEEDGSIEGEKKSKKRRRRTAREEQEEEQEEEEEEEQPREQPRKKKRVGRV
jgi:hypothetical protein